MLISPVGARQRIFIMSLTDKDPSIWKDPNQTHLALNTRNRVGKIRRDAYLWDLHALAKRVGKNPSGGFYKIDGKSQFWNALWVDSFDDDAGSRVYENLPTTFAVAPFNHPNAERHVYESNFSLSPLITNPEATEDEDGNSVLTPVGETLDGEETLWKAAVFPAMPIVLTSSVEEHDHYGPVFLRSLNIEATGTRSMSPVTIDVSFLGGKALKCEILPATSFELISIDQEDVDLSASDLDYRHYRSANITDCSLDMSSWRSHEEMLAAISVETEQEKTKPYHRIVSMAMSIDQEVNFEVTSPKPPLSNEHGPRFASVSRRRVSGSIRLYSPEKDYKYPTSSALTLYFGGTWLFPMPNVDWQKPKSSVKAGDGYVHTLEFIARAAPNAITKGFSDESAGYPVSEFDIPTVQEKE